MHSETVEQIATPSADQQSSRKKDYCRTSSAHQDGYADNAQQPKVEEVEQSTWHPPDVPPADRGRDERIATVVDNRLGGVPPAPPLDRLIQDNDHRQHNKHHRSLPEVACPFHDVALPPGGQPAPSRPIKAGIRGAVGLHRQRPSCLPAGWNPGWLLPALCGMSSSSAPAPAPWVRQAGPASRVLGDCRAQGLAMTAWRREPPPRCAPRWCSTHRDELPFARAL